MKRTSVLYMIHILLGSTWVLMFRLLIEVHRDRYELREWAYVLFPVYAVIYAVAGRILFRKSQAEIESDEMINITLLGILNTFLTLTWVLTMIYITLCFLSSVVALLYFFSKFS